MNLTANEIKALRGIANSDFMDGPPEAGKAIWSWSGNPFDSARTFSGVVASLSKKGLVVCYGEGEDACIELTEAGLAAYRERSEGEGG